jgi:hypothetical protein
VIEAKRKKRATLFLSAVVIFFAILFQVLGVEGTWSLWQIPFLPFSFGDFRTITAGAEAVGLGLDPLLENPLDPWLRPLNYPRLWQGLYWFGVKYSHTAYIGSAVIGLFIISLYWFLAKLDTRSFFISAFGIFSPSTILAVERCNADLLMFVLIVLSVLALQKNRLLASCTLILTASVLKLFPIFSLLILLRERKIQALRYIAVSFTIFLIYMVATWRDILLVKKISPISSWLSYGFHVLWMRAVKEVPASGPIVKALSGLALAVIAIYIFNALRLPEIVRRDDEPREYLDWFRAGAVIYVSSFLVIGNNFDYRLIFLILTLPQLALWIKLDDHHSSKISLATLLGIFGSFWYLGFRFFLLRLPFGKPISFLTDEFFHWLAFGGLSYLLALSAPEWTKSPFRAFPKLHARRR